MFLNFMIFDLFMFLKLFFLLLFVITFRYEISEQCIVLLLLVIVSQFGKASVFLMAKLLFELNVFHWGMLIFLSPFVVIASIK